MSEDRVIKPGTAVADVSALFKVGGKSGPNPFAAGGSSSPPSSGTVAGNPFLQAEKKKGPPPATKPKKTPPAVAPKKGAPTVAGKSGQSATKDGGDKPTGKGGKLSGKLAFMNSLNASIGGGSRPTPSRTQSTSALHSGGKPVGRLPTVPLGLGAMLAGGRPKPKPTLVVESPVDFDSPMDRITSPLASSMLKDKAVLARKSMRPKRPPTADHWARRK